MITFKEMIKSIAEKWRNVDDETRAYCEMIANEELARHKRDVAEYKKTYGEEAFKAVQSAYSKSKLKGKRKHEESEHEVEESDGNIADTSVALETNNFTEDSNNIGTTYPAESSSLHGTDTSITSNMFNNSNHQVTPYTNNFLPLLNNNMSTAYASASLPKHTAGMSTSESAAVEATASASYMNNLNNTIGTSHTLFPQQLLQSNQFNAVKNNNFNWILKNIGASYPAFSLAHPATHFNNTPSNDCMANYIIRSKLMELQQQGQGSLGYSGAGAQPYGMTGLAATNQAPRFQGQALSVLPNNISNALEQLRNNEDNKLSKDEFGQDLWQS